MRKMSAINIAGWKRRKAIYERRQKGETQAAIADDLGMSVQRVREAEHYWKDLLIALDDEPDDRARGIYKQLCRAGVIVADRSHEYGYA